MNTSMAVTPSTDADSSSVGSTDAPSAAGLPPRERRTWYAASASTVGRARVGRRPHERAGAAEPLRPLSFADASLPALLHHAPRRPGRGGDAVPPPAAPGRLRTPARVRH